MERACPTLLRNRSLIDFDPTNRKPYKHIIVEFIEELEGLCPSKSHESFVYALMLIEKGFSLRVFIHSDTVKR